MLGHEYLKAREREAAWGVGRHIMGSQIFDYWKDPFGNELEHWTDGDLFTAADPPAKQTMQALLAVQWGRRTRCLPARWPRPRPRRLRHRASVARKAPVLPHTQGSLTDETLHIHPRR